MPTSPPPQPRGSRAMELDNGCPICLGSREGTSYVLPCLHQFCYSCILHWARSKPECPLCKRRICSIVHSVQADDNFEEHVISPPASPSAGHRQSGGDPGRPAAHSPAASGQEPAGLVPGAPPGDLQPDIWATLFQQRPALLPTLMPWILEELELSMQNERSVAEAVEDFVVPLLVLFRLEEGTLNQLLGASLQNIRATFLESAVQADMERAIREACQLLGLQSRPPAERRERPAASRRHPPLSRPRARRARRRSAPPRSPPAVPAQAQPVESGPRAPVGGLQPDTWATLFDDHPALLQRIMPWVHQQLGQIFAEHPSVAVTLGELVMCVLGLSGLDQEALLRLLQDSLQDRAARFVEDLLDVAVQRCGREAHQLLGLQGRGAAERRERPAASPRGPPDSGPGPSSSPAGAPEEERPTTSTAALQGCPRSTTSVPIPARGEQEEQVEDPEEAVPGPSTPSQGRDCSPGTPRRAPKRRASSPQDSSQPPKRPPRQQQ